ncbi:MAG: FAD-binding oxidoreductase [Sulfuritalea sp.]|nr:FAD-binding oxidoreductase [Sulfuritalea sp.]
MPRLRYQDRILDCRENEKLLDACLRQGVSLPFSCRGGTCQICLHLCLDGDLPAESQRGIKPDLKQKGYFLPCVCVPGGDMQFAPPNVDDLYTKAVVQTRDWLAPDVCRILLEPYTDFPYRPGQFINLRRPDGLVRSYSLASHPDDDPYLQIHVKRMKNGVMSNWLCDELQVGDTVEIQGANGDFHYGDTRADQPMLLVVTGTGLAPALGVIRDAIARRHAAPIHLYQGVSHRAGLYLHHALRAFARAHATFHYHPCVSLDTKLPAGIAGARAELQASADHPDLSGWRVFLAGLPAMVASATALALQHGAAESNIVRDPFDVRDLRTAPRSAKANEQPAASVAPATETPQPVADPELWAALDDGRLLRPILDDFYGRVFEDPLLAPFFHNTTKQRSIEKVHSFLQQVFTGNKAYFGDRPRNAHHWMVISNELFDYREDLLVDCLHRHGLPEHLIQRWRKMEECYRPDIVKPAPWKRVQNGVELPLDGFGRMILDVGSVCDGCGGEIGPGETVQYHLRLGSTYCPGCSSNHTGSSASAPEESTS